MFTALTVDVESPSAFEMKSSSHTLHSVGITQKVGCNGNLMTMSTSTHITVKFDCPSMHRWALMGYFTHLHISVQTWNKTHCGSARVTVSNSDYCVHVQLNMLDAYKWRYTWNCEYPQLTNYTIIDLP